MSLRWTSDFNQADLPDLDREDPDKILQLAKVWDINGLLHLAPPALEESMVPSCLRVFNCLKSSLVDRQIGDRRGMNQIEAYLPGPSRFLPSGYHLGVLEVDPKKESVVTCISDRRDFYHQISVSPQRASSNKLWPPLPLEVLRGTKAHEGYMAQNYAKRKKRERLVEGDRFVEQAVEDVPLVNLGTSKEMAFCCFGSVIQGDHLGVEIATQGHRGLLEAGGLLAPEEEIQSCRPFAGRKTLQGLVIDDYFAISVAKDEDLENGRVPVSKTRFDTAQAIYHREGLLGSKDKDVVNARSAKIAGAELVSDDYVKDLGVIPLGSPASKRLALSFLSLELSKASWSTDALHACLVGGWTSCLMFRRPLMSVFDHVYHCVDMSAVDQAAPKLFKMSRQVKEELVLMAILAPLICSDLAAQTIPWAFATDASDKKGAFVSAKIPESLQECCGGQAEEKGAIRGCSPEKRPFFLRLTSFLRRKVKRLPASERGVVLRSP